MKRDMKDALRTLLKFDTCTWAKGLPGRLETKLALNSHILELFFVYIVLSTKSRILTYSTDETHTLVYTAQQSFVFDQLGPD
jgi:hypothetical protein